MKITKYRKVEKEGSLLAFLSIEYEDQYGTKYINNIALIRNREGHNFISMPSREYLDEGQKKYASYIGYTARPATDKFQEDVLLALQGFINQNPQNHTRTQSNETGGTQECVQPPLVSMHPHARLSGQINYQPYPHVNSQVQVKMESSALDQELPF
jgi:DNA-binding cell septation regulator SpoVG